MTVRGLSKKRYSGLKRIYKAATRTDWIMALCSVCLLVVAATAAVISYFQWHEMHAGGADTHELAESAKAQADAVKAEADSMKSLAERTLRQAEATDKLAEQAEKSASASIQSARDADISTKATKDMVKLSEKTLENAKLNIQLDQRPWISITSVRLTKFQANSKIEAQVGFLNSGRSPALRISIIGTVLSLDNKIEPNFLPIGPDSSAKAFRAIPPQGSNVWTQDSLQIIGDDEKDRIEHLFHIIWVSGYIRYYDAFGDVHVTQFCGYTRDRPATSKITEGMDLYLCLTNGEMD
jgi:hypothetical protein